MVRFFRNHSSQSFARDDYDYKDFVELSLLIISKGLEPQSFKMHYSGKPVYSTKVIFLSTEIKQQFPKGEILSRQHLIKLEWYVVFSVSVYVQ